MPLLRRCPPLHLLPRTLNVSCVIICDLIALGASYRQTKGLFAPELRWTGEVMLKPLGNRFTRAKEKEKMPMLVKKNKINIPLSCNVTKWSQDRPQDFSNEIIHI